MQTHEQIREHYEIERELANRLRGAQRESRGPMYGVVYDELFRRVPHHPQLTRKRNPGERAAAVAERFSLLAKFLRPDTRFLEIGAGDCSLSEHVAQHVARCYALDVSQEILAGHAHDNLETVLSDGCSVPLPPDSVTLAYSYQVMEHIHPEDAVDQLRNIFRVLAPGGSYLCVTPSRLNGPHDVSRYFEDVASGFHLKEYTFSELDGLFRAAGFRETHAYVGMRHRYFRMPWLPLRAIEAVLGALPGRLRRWLGNLPILRNVLFISLLAVK